MNLLGHSASKGTLAGAVGWLIRITKARKYEDTK